MQKYNRPRDTFDYARQAWKAAMQIKRLVNVEQKHHYFTTSFNNASTWQLFHISGVPQGDGSFQRDGISIKPLQVTVKIHFSTISSRAFMESRVLLLRGKSEQGDGATEYLNAYTEGPFDMVAFKTNTTRYNSQTLYDKVYHVEATNPIAGSTSKYVEFNVKLDRHITYDGTNTVAEDGGLYLMFAGLDGTGTGNNVIEFNSCMSFVDN